MDKIERLVDNLKASEMELNNEDSESKDKTVTDIPTRNGPGLLDLPPEIRYIIFRHLLLHDDLRQFYWYFAPQNYLAILKTNKVINREASDVFYRENTFVDCFWTQRSRTRIAWSPRIINMIQNIQIYLIIHGTEEALIPLKRDTAVSFMKFIQDFENRSIVRGTLAVTFWVDHFVLPSMPEFICRLGQFTHFRTIEESFRNNKDPPNDITNIRDYVRTALEHMLGYAEEFESDGSELKCLRFHPLDFSRAQSASQEEFGEEAS